MRISAFVLAAAMMVATVGIASACPNMLRTAGKAEEAQVAQGRATPTQERRSEPQG